MYIKHIQRLRGCEYTHTDYLTQKALRPAGWRYGRPSRASLASLTPATDHKITAEASVQLKEKELMKP